jgi:hypothetical protein
MTAMRTSAGNDWLSYDELNGTAILRYVLNRSSSLRGATSAQR